MKNFELSVNSGFDIQRQMHLQRLDVTLICAQGRRLGVTINQGTDLHALAEALRELASSIDQEARNQDVIRQVGLDKPFEIGNGEVQTVGDFLAQAAKVAVDHA